MIKELKSHWYRYILGGLFGAIPLLLIYSFYSNVLFSQPSEISYDCNSTCSHYVKMSHDSLHKLITIFKDETKNITDVNEKMASLNTRINDFYIFAGIVITLLLAINISVFINTSSEVKKHMDENFIKQKKEIETHLDDAKKLVGEIRAERDMSKTKNDSANQIV